jgi:hypothetical protein
MAGKRKIKPNKEKLNIIYEQVSEDKKEIAKDLIKELVFMAETLDELKENVKNNGAITLFEQGKQTMYIENPAMKSYNTTIQRYGTIYKQLIDLLPKEVSKVEDDGFETFINDRTD